MGSSLSAGRVFPRVGIGPYGVGCVDVMTADAPHGDSGVFARIFYPVDEISPDSNLPIWMERREYITGIAGYLKTSSRKAHLIADWIIGERRIPCAWEARLSSSSPPPPRASSSSFSSHRPSTVSSCSVPSTSSFTSPPFPVIIFSHGLAGCRHFYSSFCSSMASYGFVVAAIEHRDFSACWTYKIHVDENGEGRERPVVMMPIDDMKKEYKIRNQQLHKRVSECVRLLHVLEEINLGQVGPSSQGSRLLLGQKFDWGQFKNRLDLSRLSIVGHSFGGATALAACAFSTEFRSAVVLDGWMVPIDGEVYERVSQPVLFLNAGRFQWKENVEKMKKFAHARAVIYTLTDAQHYSFTDLPFLVKPFFGRKLRLQGDTDPLLMAEAIVEMSTRFIQKTNEEESAEVALLKMVDTKYAFLAIPNTEEAHL